MAMGWIDSIASFDGLRMRETECAICIRGHQENVRGHEENLLILSPSKDARPSCSPTCAGER